MEKRIRAYSQAWIGRDATAPPCEAVGAAPEQAVFRPSQENEQKKEKCQKGG